MYQNANVSVCFVGKKEGKIDFDMSIKALLALLLTLQLNLISFIGLK
jgi:hypothetical protein